MMREDHDTRTDAHLIESVRKGDQDAYGSLYLRYHVVASRLARQLARCPADADDFVAEAFVSALSLITRQLGPSEMFRPYLLTAVRHAAYSRARMELRYVLKPDLDTEQAAAVEDTMTDRFDRSLARRAFRTLPPRWRAVLGLTEIAQLPLSQAAQQLGLNPNGVAALSYRAREGLRQAFLREHLDRSASVLCGPIVSLLGGWVRNGLSRQQAVRVRAHVDRCARCAELAEELRQTNLNLRPRQLGRAQRAQHSTPPPRKITVTSPTVT